jgi:hypothetical protein
LRPELSEVNQPNKPYSKAFEDFVQDPDDIVGLLAYAFFKAGIRERVATGQNVPRELRNPTQADIEAYRGRAERALELYATKAIEDAEPGITAAAHGTAKDEIIREVQRRTGLWPAVVSGVVVWVVTILLTIVAVFGAPGWVRALVEHAIPQ